MGCYSCGSGAPVSARAASSGLAAIAEACDSADAPMSARAASFGAAGAAFENGLAGPAVDDTVTVEFAELASAVSAADAAAAAAPAAGCAESERDLTATARLMTEPIIAAALEAVFAVAQELAAPVADGDADPEPQTILGPSRACRWPSCRSTWPRARRSRCCYFTGTLIPMRCSRRSAVPSPTA